jgi:hypothetical protein
MRDDRYAKVKREEDNYDESFNKYSQKKFNKINRKR